jgi:hypothetical protein
MFPCSTAAGGVIEIPFEASNFSDPLTIDNPFLPMVPVTTQTYRAEGADGCEVDVVTVTNGEKTINIDSDSIQVRVVEDLAYEDPGCDGSLTLVETTIDWFGQDDAGNVWYFGEDTVECENGVCPPGPGPGSWEAGVDGAEPGIVMLAEPDNGDQYHQEFYEGFAEDQAKVTGISVKVELQREDAIELPADANCIKTKEWNPLEPGHTEQKYYCEDIGLVAVDEHHGKELRFELVDPDGGTTETNDALQFRTVPKQ